MSLIKNNQNTCYKYVRKLTLVQIRGIIFSKNVR